MLRTILLISPVFVTLLWSISLAGYSKRYSNPRLYLAWFMILPLVIFSSYLFYFAPLRDIYPYFDVVLQYASLLVFPAYYIYFRLLTVDEKFTLRVHARYFAIPTLIFVLYGVGVLFTPAIEFRTWLFNENAFPDSTYIHFLNVMRIIIRITYLIQVVVSVIANHLLIQKYGKKAEQFYSNLEDGKYNNAKMLNYSIIVMGFAAFIFTALGRSFLMPQDILIYSGWSIFSVMLYIIGYMGIKQKPINPTFETVTNETEPALKENELIGTQKKILHKIQVQFDEKKIYLNSQLNIMDIVQEVGTNRTYISTIINQQYGLNFCTFVNNYRLEELERVIHQNHELNNETLAECCGFGSVHTLKRAIYAKTGLSISEWKSQQLSFEQPIQD